MASFTPHETAPAVLNITSLSTRGEGIAHPKGKATFVPFTLPGEIWKVQIIEQKKNYDRALPIELVARDKDAPPRVTPVCPYYGACGGCQLQHISYDDQLKYKRRWLEETFRRVAHLELKLLPIIPSPPWQYRNKLTLLLRMEQGRIVYAFHHIYQPNRFVSVNDCCIAHALIRQAMPIVLDALNKHRPSIPPASITSPQGSRVQFRTVDGNIFLTFHNTGFISSNARQFRKELLGSQARVTEIIFSDSDENTETYSDSAISPDMFLQVNDSVREHLYQYVLDLPYSARRSVLDGYCGVGVLTCCLKDRFEHVVGVEINSSSAANAQRAVETAGLNNHVVIHNLSLENFLEKNNQEFDCFILNPPRAGLSSEVRRHLTRRRPPEIVMVSCHPAALARDGRALTEAEYRILSLQPFDMFPQTYHLEVVAHLRHEQGR